MNDVWKYGSLIVMFVIVILLYGNERKNAGSKEMNDKWINKFVTAIPDTVTRIDTVRMKPEILRVKEKIVVAKIDTIKTTICEDVEVIFVDTSGGEHAITYRGGELSETFLAPARPIVTRTITKDIPVEKIIEVTPGWLFGLSGEFDREGGQGIGTGFILGRAPLYISSRYYFESKAMSYGIGLYFTF
jgi:hypothetical protein